MFVRGELRIISVFLLERCKKCHYAYNYYGGGYDGFCKKCLEIIEGRLCIKCKVHKKREEFHKDNRSFSGMQSVCKDCRLADKERYRMYRKRYKEKIRKQKIGILKKNKNSPYT